MQRVGHMPGLGIHLVVLAQQVWVGTSNRCPMVLWVGAVL